MGEGTNNNAKAMAILKEIRYCYQQNYSNVVLKTNSLVAIRVMSRE